MHMCAYIYMSLRGLAEVSSSVTLYPTVFQDSLSLFHGTCSFGWAGWPEGIRDLPVVIFLELEL